MSTTPRPVLLATDEFLKKAIADGTAVVLDQPALRRYQAACVEKGLNADEAIADLTPTLCFQDGQREPRMLYTKLEAPADEVEKGILSDLLQGYGCGSKELVVPKTGAEVKAQVAAMLPGLVAEAATMTAAMATLLATIGLAPPTRADRGLEPIKAGTDGLSLPDIATYPWRETEWREGGDSESAHPGMVRDSLSTEATAAVDRAPKSAEDAANRNRYNDLAWSLRENLRDQVAAQRIAAVLPATAKFQLPLPLLVALRFGSTTTPDVTIGAASAGVSE